MKKYFPLLFLIYTIIVEVFLLHIGILYGVLADERIKNDVGVDILNVGSVFILTLGIQIIYIVNLIKNNNKV